MTGDIWIRTASRDKLEIVIKHLLASARPQFSGEVLMTTERTTYGWGMNLQDDWCFRLLRAWSDGRITWANAARTLSAMLSASATTVDDFERFLLQVESESRAHNQPDSWKLVIPWEVDPMNGEQVEGTLQSLGEEFHLQTWNALTAELPQEGLENALRGVRLHLRKLHYPKLVLVAASTGPDSLRAWASIRGAHDALRGAIEFSLNANRTSFSSPPRPRCDIPLSPWVLAWNQKSGAVEELYFWGTRLADDSRRFQLNADTFNALAKRCLTLLPSPDSNSDTNSLIADGFRLYADAMDYENDHHAFLSFWQLAELLTLDESDRGNSDQVCKRLNRLVHRRVVLSPSDTDAPLKSLAALRNKAVHSGLIDGITQDEVAFLKTVCEQALFWILNHREQLPSRTHLRHFHELADANDAKLAAITSVVKLIQETRTAATDD